MVINSPNSLVTKADYGAAIRAHHLDVVDWIFLERDH